MNGNGYQIQPVHIVFVPQVLFEVEAVHVFIDETKRMCLSRVHTNEWHHVHALLVKEGPHVSFVAEPLQRDYQYSSCIGCGRNVPRRPERHRMTCNNDTTSRQPCGRHASPPRCLRHPRRPSGAHRRDRCPPGQANDMRMGGMIGGPGPSVHSAERGTCRSILE